MTLRALPFGKGSNLDVDETSVAQGFITLTNAYVDRADAIRTIPGNEEYATLVAGGGNVYTYPSKNFGVVIAYCDGRIFKQSTFNGVVEEITGAVLSSGVVPAFTEDTDYIFVAANSAIYRIDPTGTTAEALGAIVEEESTTVDFGVAVTEEGAAPNPRLLTLVSDGAKAVYYTVDGSTPSTASTLYTFGSKISIESTLTFKCIAYDGDDNPSDVVTKEYIVEPVDVVNPQLKTFTVGTVTGNSVVITGIGAVDKSGVTAYCVTEDTEAAPDLNDPKWLATYNNVKYYSRTAAAGTRTLRAWARDAAGNVDSNVILREVAFGAADTAPDAFSFTDVTDTARSVYVESEARTLTGITYDTTITIADGEYAISKNGGLAWTNWRTASGTYSMGDVIKVRHLTSADNETSTVTTLTVGGVDGTFTSTTAATQLPRSVKKLAYMDGYLVAIGQPAEGDSVAGDVMFSDDKANNYAAWEVYNNETNPDVVQNVIEAFGRLYNVGLQTLEVTVDDGVTPFAANRNAFQPYGTMAPDSVAFDGESIYYITEIAKTRKIVQLRHGATPKIISLPLDLPLEKMTSVADARGFTMGFRGQNFYCLDFPSANIVIDDQQYDSVTLAYHLQKESWIILGKYNADEGIFTQYRGCSCSYVEAWGATLIGGRNGKLYRLVENTTVDYTAGPVLLHRWQNDHRTTWSNPRTIKLYPAGDTRYPPDQHQCGQYRFRRHELSYSDMSDAGEIFRAVMRTGWDDAKKEVGKIAAFYRYNVKRGSNDFVLNKISEETTYLRR